MDVAYSYSVHGVGGLSVGSVRQFMGTYSYRLVIKMSMECSHWFYGTSFFELLGRYGKGAYAIRPLPNSSTSLLLLLSLFTSLLSLARPCRGCTNLARVSIYPSSTGTALLWLHKPRLLGNSHILHQLSILILSHAHTPNLNGEPPWIHIQHRTYFFWVLGGSIRSPRWLRGIREGLQH